MKTLRYRIGNEVKPGILDSDENIHDASSLVSDWDNENVTIEKLNEIKSMDISSLPKVEIFDGIAPCVCKKSVGKIICIGLNYSDHAEETGMKVPPEPIIFFKATSSIIGPNDDVIIPKNSQKSDWEVELGIVIGKEAKYISENESQDHIAGYCVVNDLSERAFQIERSGQWVKGKSCDTFGPIGPYLVTKDEIPDPQNLKLWLELNGKRVQDGSTATMVYGVNFLVSYLSQFMSLHPGDIISTGTPPGVGMGMNPQVFLKPGDIMELGVEGLGSQKQKTVAA
ncbi:fumarylacetoacetate hydrolase family protein [Alphaproteobacteria bacterium]|nr:fumarylacetoacetate hydrolase family protein [Alphaproteobacteria bacterium]